MMHLSRAAVVGACAVLAATSALGLAPAAVAEPVGVLQSCSPSNGLVIAITGGDVDCASAYYYASQYDQYGDKYQTIAPFTCYSGNALTAPLLFTCVSQEPAGEFAVYPA